MSKDPTTPERYAVDAMNMAVGALKAKRTDGDGVDHVIAKLEIAIGKFDQRCDHEWEGFKSPNGGLAGVCKKCSVTRYTQ
jgi:hypothetical protein